MNISMDNGYGTTYTFRVVEKIPREYDVWNIHGIKDHPDYVPLCRCYSGTYDVMTNILLAVKLDTPEEVEILSRASGYGASTAKKCKRMLSRKNMPEYERKALEKALPILEKYTA